MNKDTFVMLLPAENKINIIACLPKSTLNLIQRYAHLQRVDLHNMIEHIIKSFSADIDDLMYFARGEVPRTPAEHAMAIWKGNEERNHMTFQISPESFRKIMVYKESYKINKSLILKRFIMKYNRLKEEGSF